MTDIASKLLGLVKIPAKINTAACMRFAMPLNIKLSVSASMATWAIRTRNAVRKEFAAFLEDQQSLKYT